MFHDEDEFVFTIGKGEVMREGTDVAIIANGLLVAEAVEAGKLLEQRGISARDDSPRSGRTVRPQPFDQPSATRAGAARHLRQGHRYGHHQAAG